jgi:phosphopantetheinyl transferase (holo-ACP synthase)
MSASGIRPRDSVKTMLAAQMAAIHNATMTFARRLAHVDNIKQQDSAQNALNKLARTFAAQVAALKNYRSKGKQRVLVEHVHVHTGGQAIVGAVTAGPGGAKKTEDQPHALGFETCPEMLGDLEKERASKNAARRP